MELVWNDGGRAAAGYVGIAGDCVVRAIALANNEDYAAVYKELGEAALTTPRRGVASTVYGPYLRARGWKSHSTDGSWHPDSLPRGVVLVRFEALDGHGRGHLCCVIDHVIHDTWNAFDELNYRVAEYWISTTVLSGGDAGRPRSRVVESEETLRTREEYDRILKRVRALNATATNHASTEGEIRNALNAMQALMTKHNLTRGDLVDRNESLPMGMTRQACVVNGVRVCQWESALAQYLTQEIFPGVQYYRQRHGHRTLYWFYGPWSDVGQVVEVYREMLLTIATAARLKYGGYARGSGASYAEGYVRGLPRSNAPGSGPGAVSPETVSTGADAEMNRALVQRRMALVRDHASEWLAVECGIRLRSYRFSGRTRFDAGAHQAGTRDGAKHEAPQRRDQKRLPHRPTS